MAMQSTSKILKIGFGIGAVAICVVSLRYILRKKNSQAPGQTWHHIGALKEITFYPIKSSSAVELEEAECDSHGLRQFGFIDRQLFLMHEADDKVACVSNHPLMLSIMISIRSDGCLQLKAPNVEPLNVNLNDFEVHESRIISKQMEGYRLKLIEGLPVHHIWFSRVILGKESGIRFCIALNPIVNPSVKKSWWRTIAGNLMPIMALHNKSIEELNSMVSTKKQIHHKQFRGNLLIESKEDVAPFDEDKWLWLKIGESEENSTILLFNSPCLRCIIPNIDVFNCQRNEDFEPLKTMRKFRLRSHPKDPEMGIYFDVYKEGVVKCGAPVFVQYKST